MINAERARMILAALKRIMSENQDYLMQLDSEIGDGDLGLTMNRAFGSAADQLADTDEVDVGTIFAKAGMAMAKAAPSTMGTLVATGFMKAGKALKGKTEIGEKDVATFFRAFSDGVMERGKTKPGNKTIVDVMDPVASVVEGAVAEGEGFEKIGERAIAAAQAGEEAAREMTSQHGKAAIYREKTKGKSDPGANVGVLIVCGFFSVT